jgi:hypothetical protein
MIVPFPACRRLCAATPDDWAAKVSRMAADHRRVAIGLRQGMIGRKATPERRYQGRNR